MVSSVTSLQDYGLYITFKPQKSLHLWYALGQSYGCF